MEKVCADYLIEALREEVISRESEIEAIRKSLRFKVGGFFLEAAPLSFNSISIFLTLLRLYFRTKGRYKRESVLRSAPSDSDSSEGGAVLVFGRECPSLIEHRDSICFENAKYISVLIDSGFRDQTLVLRNTDQEILRRLKRAQMLGWHIIWCPHRGEEAPARASYVRAHADVNWEAETI